MGDLSIQDLVVEYSSGGYALRPINGLNLDVAAGSLVILLGPSGCGKTTLLSCLGGILRPKSGTIKFGGINVTTMDYTGGPEPVHVHAGYIDAGFLQTLGVTPMMGRRLIGD